MDESGRSKEKTDTAHFHELRLSLVGMLQIHLVKFCVAEMEKDSIKMLPKCEAVLWFFREYWDW